MFQTCSNIWLLQMALPEVKSNLPLITIPTTGVSVKWFFALCMQHTDSEETREVIINDNWEVNSLTQKIVPTSVTVRDIFTEKIT